MQQTLENNSERLASCFDFFVQNWNVTGISGMPSRQMTKSELEICRRSWTDRILGCHSWLFYVIPHHRFRRRRRHYPKPIIDCFTTFLFITCFPRVFVFLSSDPPTADTSSLQSTIWKHTEREWVSLWPWLFPRQYTFPPSRFQGLFCLYFPFLCLTNGTATKDCLDFSLLVISLARILIIFTMRRPNVRYAQPGIDCPVFECLLGWLDHGGWTQSIRLISLFGTSN